jgi:hypothetical protein
MMRARLALAAAGQQARANSSSTTQPSAAATAAAEAASAAATSAAEARAAAQAAADALSPSEREQLRVAHYVLQRPARSGLHAGLLTALAATHRDLHVALDALHKRDALGVARPLLDAPPLSPGDKTTAAQQPTSTQMFYPVRDLTRLPDTPEPVAGPPSHLRGAYMGKGAGPWQQLLPNHIEVSYALGAVVPLWPAMEACFPMFIDFDAAVRQLRQGSTRGRIRAGARRRRKDKPYSVFVNTDSRENRQAARRRSGGDDDKAEE